MDTARKVIYNPGVHKRFLEIRALKKQVVDITFELDKGEKPRSRGIGPAKDERCMVAGHGCLP